MSKENDWKKRLGIVYSTNSDFEFNTNESEQSNDKQPSDQTLRIQLSTKHRKGKIVTLITGFTCNDKQLKIIEKELKTRCATGGTSKDNEIIIQGDFRAKVEQYLKSAGFKVKGS